jgi:hypothetical protein
VRRRVAGAEDGIEPLIVEFELKFFIDGLQELIFEGFRKRFARGRLGIHVTRSMRGQRSRQRAGMVVRGHDGRATRGNARLVKG